MMRNLIIPMSLILLFISCTSKSGENLIKAVKDEDFEKVKKIVTAENVNSADETGADIRKTKDEEDKTQELLMKIIRQQRGKEGSCTRIKTMTKSFPEEVKKVEGEQTNSSSAGGKRSRFSVAASVEWRIGSIPEIAKKGGRTAEVTEHFFRENRESVIIKGIENFSCKTDGFTSDAGCWKHVDGQYLYKSEDCPKPSLSQPDITFSKPILDPETNLVFVYEFWYCGDLCARESLVVYELKSDGKLELKHWFTLRVS